MSPWRTWPIVAPASWGWAPTWSCDAGAVGPLHRGGHRPAGITRGLQAAAAPAAQPLAALREEDPADDGVDRAGPVRHLNRDVAPHRPHEVLPAREAHDAARVQQGA